MTIGTVTLTVEEKVETKYLYLVGNDKSNVYEPCTIFKEQTGKTSCGTGDKSDDTVQEMVRISFEKVEDLVNYPNQSSLFGIWWEAFNDDCTFSISDPS